MRRSTIFRTTTLTGILFGLACSTHAQPTNKPSVTATQVSPPTTVATAGEAHTVSWRVLALINLIRERGAVGRFTDTIIFASAGYFDVHQTTQFFDGLGRPIQTVLQQATLAAIPSDLVSDACRL